MPGFARTYVATSVPVMAAPLAGPSGVKRVANAAAGVPGFGLAAKPIVCGSDSALAVAAFEPAHHEVRTRHLLEVVDEGVVHRCTTERADDPHGLRFKLA